MFLALIIIFEQELMSILNVTINKILTLEIYIIHDKIKYKFLYFVNMR